VCTPLFWNNKRFNIPKWESIAASRRTDNAMAKRKTTIYVKNIEVSSISSMFIRSSFLPSCICDISWLSCLGPLILLLPKAFLLLHEGRKLDLMNIDEILLTSIFFTSFLYDKKKIFIDFYYRLDTKWWTIQ
jgi:hypothetical protein